MDLNFYANEGSDLSKFVKCCKIVEICKKV